MPLCLAATPRSIATILDIQSAASSPGPN
jgi:hypothetical protein